MSTTPNPSKLRKKLKAAQKSHTSRFAAVIPLLTGFVLAAQEQLPLLSSFLSGWQLFLASTVISGIVITLDVLKEGDTDAD